MNEIYWLTRVGELNGVLGFLWIMPTIILLLMVIALPIFGEDWNDKFKDMLKKWAWRLIILIVIGVIGDAFTPSKKDVLLIYGLGGTIDYVKSNDKAKELPDKVVDALTRYVDTIAKEEKE